MKNIDWEGIFVALLAVLFGAVAAIAIFIWTAFLVLAQIILHNFKWILLSATALILGYWYL